jgi:hypothetical protein
MCYTLLCLFFGIGQKFTRAESDSSECFEDSFIRTGGFGSNLDIAKTVTSEAGIYSRIYSRIDGSAKG